MCHCEGKPVITFTLLIIYLTLILLFLDSQNYISDDHRFTLSLLRISEASFFLGVRTGIVVGGDEEEDAGTESVADMLVFCCVKDFH